MQVEIWFIFIDWEKTDNRCPLCNRKLSLDSLSIKIERYDKKQVFALFTLTYFRRCHSNPLTLISWPWSVFTDFGNLNSEIINFPGTTWYLRIAFNFSLSFNKPSSVPAGNFSNASFVGAKTVNGPGLLSFYKISANNSFAQSGKTIII